MTRQQKSNEEPEETPDSKTPYEPASSPDPVSLPTPTPTEHQESKQAESEAARVLAAVQKSAQLQTQNLELVVSRVDQMAGSLAHALKAMQDSLEVMKTVADLQQEFLASLNEQTERLVTVSAALIRYSQEQAAMIASGGSQA